MYLEKNRTSIVTFDNALSDKLLTEAYSRDFIFYCILKLLGFTGIRPVDLLKLRVKDLDFDNKRIRVRISKTSKEILFPMYDELETFLREEMKDIVNQNSDTLLIEGYSVDRVGRKFRRMKVRLGILEKYKFNLKTFRKTFATQYAKKLNIQDVAYLLGHDKTENTRTFYADVVVDDIRNKMEKK
ncbi:MAG: site-specific integrase [Ignavibacteria bacterium]|nr:site-specific integrase [Ignavibacteria bacterium]